MGVGASEREGLNVSSTNLTEFFEDLEGRLSLITGMTPYEDTGLTLQDIRKPILVTGLPGIGKTCGIMSIQKKLNRVLPKDKQLGFKKILLGQTVVGSLQGIPVFIPSLGRVERVQIPDLPNVEKDGEYGILFLDEITTADEAQVQPALGLCDDSRCLGEYTLPEHWLVVAAGNGPESTNFLRLDDMTLSRFMCYDIVYDYKTDWRNWAHANGIDANIIAFLNFDETFCLRVESTDMDKAGKMFPCPRTWERLSRELAIRTALNRPVNAEEIHNFAGRIVGAKAGTAFGAFCAYNKSVKYSPERILDGTEAEPKQMPKQEYHILLQACFKLLEQRLEPLHDGNGNYDIKGYEYVSNFIRWIIAFEEFDYEACMQAIVEIRMTDWHTKKIITASDIYQVCPEFKEFLGRNAEYLLSNINDIQAALG